MLIGEPKIQSETKILYILILALFFSLIWTSIPCHGVFTLFSTFDKIVKAENSPADIKTLLYKVNRDVPLAKEIVLSNYYVCMHVCA